MIAAVDPDTLVEISGFVFKMWVVLVALGLPAQALLVAAFGSAQRRRQVIMAILAAGAALVAALVADIAFYPYDGFLRHTVILWATLVLFSMPAQLLFFFAVFRLKRILARLTAFAGGAALITLGVLAFGARTFAYSLQQSLGGWP